MKLNMNNVYMDLFFPLKTTTKEKYLFSDMSKSGHSNSGIVKLGLSSSKSKGFVWLSSYYLPRTIEFCFVGSKNNISVKFSFILTQIKTKFIKLIKNY